ncbi:MAG: bifunctional phosphopantothenoylcysteine decarboxylase/phosphopantothenate--cysteine ligase CoaBC [Hyphomicrobium sp.]
MGEKRVLLIIGGGIAAYKCLDLIRRLRERGVAVRVVMTKAAEQFVTPLSVGALTNDRVFSDLFNLDDEREIGHIRLARDSDLVVVAPATADLLAKMAGGHANDLATCILLATDRPVLAVPAMNPRMWQNKATCRNVAQLKDDGIHFLGPAVGEMAERGEAGAGRLVEVPEIVAAIERLLALPAAAVAAKPAEPLRLVTPGPLKGRHVLITAGPTHEPIDPVRYIANRSSGKQGYALAAAAARLGARVTLISGPVALAPPDSVELRPVVTAAEMLAAVNAALPADIAIFAAAVADWRVAKPKSEKIKKKAGDSAAPKLKLAENPDILKAIAHDKRNRPALVIGFAAETETVLAHARRKLKSKGCDWIVANDVSPETGIMGGDRNTVHLLTGSGVEDWPDMTKEKVAERLIGRAAAELTRLRTAAAE